MEVTIIVAIIGLVGTLFGSIVGAYSGSSKAIADLRLDVKAIQTEMNTLSKRVDKHNNFAERMPVLEEKLAVYRCKKDFLEQELLRAREKKVIETNKKRLKETIKCVKRLDRMLNEVKPKIEESKSILVKIG